MAKRTTLVSLLKQNNKITIDEIKRKLGLQDNEEVYTKLTSALDNALKRLDWNDTGQNYKYIYKIFPLLEQPPADIDVEQLQKTLNKIKDTYEAKLARKIKKGENIPFDNIIIYILDSIDSIIIKLNISNDPNQISTQEEIAYKIMEYLIYDERNYLYVCETLKNFPYLLNVRNKNGKTLIDNLVNKYIKTVIQNKKHYDIIYFERIIKLFIESPNFNFDKQYKKELINRLNNAISDIKTKDISKEEADRVTFYLTELIKDIQHLQVPSTLADIEFKYDINSLMEDAHSYYTFFHIRQKLQHLDNTKPNLSGGGGTLTQHPPLLKKETKDLVRF